ncbi:MAG: sulfotransferase [Bacteroidota bacterium]
MPNPDFICIGAQKAGTTWLHHQLNQHPEVWMPPVKELHFFDQQDVSRRIYLLFRKGRRKRTTINQLRRVVRGDEPRWMLTYLFTKRTPSNYTKLFYPQEYQISGECTPAYARLELEAVAKIAQLEPQPKIIYLLRNPVDRAWSQVNFFRQHIICRIDV